MDSRRSKIFISVVRGYIKEAEPIGSEYVASRYRFGVSPATIRNELFQLTQDGYLEQPHTSAGRIPTNKGWRFYINEAAPYFDQMLRGEGEGFGGIDSWEALVRRGAEASRTLSICIDEDGVLCSAGLRYLFAQPDFENRAQFTQLAETLEELFASGASLFDQLFEHAPNIFIGDENRYLQANDDIGWVFSGFETKNKKKAVGLLVGPKRMDYEQNWRILRRAEYALKHLDI